MWKNSRIAKIRIGDKFGMLTIATLPEYKQRGKQRRAMCWVDCECGNRIEVMASNLVKKNTKSCGCRHSIVTAERNGTHWLSGTRIYGIWNKMIERCENPKVKRWERYGGRGIAVCDEWHSFEVFFDWAMANGYQHHLSIERKKVNGNYEPDNCEWIPKKDQAKNRSISRWITAFGETKILADWSRDPRCVVDLNCLGHRIRTGMDPEKALTDPVKTWKRRAENRRNAS